ncbi:MAG TPA: hypothetical protein VGV17_03085 [Bosea sp. (in: a-proteobacteria)]|jgi:hypothetical protein|uniref:hypothetical protein n=1 Tax=Bosea sp. (in: a-proteobacteria) TaxID=1871050 RepID=UPI002DDD449B|nr:hypothetical protein [Bosea sp. (in: a-proteobacteria)]HEV2552730.1 hypothetical protein [Bosea sp. (in: a-proteobacteria)]
MSNYETVMTILAVIAAVVSMIAAIVATKSAHAAEAQAGAAQEQVNLARAAIDIQNLRVAKEIKRTLKQLGEAQGDVMFSTFRGASGGERVAAERKVEQIANQLLDADKVLPRQLHGRVLAYAKEASTGVIADIQLIKSLCDEIDDFIDKDH